MNVIVQKADGVSTLTLNRPDKMNAVNTALREELIAALEDANAAPDVRAVVITGQGDRAFSAGQDLEESAALSLEELPAWLTHQRSMYQAVRNLDKGCVAALNGATLGAGFQIALCCDLRVAHPDIRLGQPEVKAGLGSIVGTRLMTMHVGFGANARLSLTGELISGAEAERLGLVTHLVRKGDVLATATDLARSMAALPATALRVSKIGLRQMSQPAFDEACDAALSLQAECYASGDPQRAQAEFVARRAR